MVETGKTKGREKTQNEMMEKGEPLAACIDVESLSGGNERGEEQGWCEKDAMRGRRGKPVDGVGGKNIRREGGK